MVCRTAINQAARSDTKPAVEPAPEVAAEPTNIVELPARGRVVELKFDDEPSRNSRRW